MTTPGGRCGAPSWGGPSWTAWRTDQRHRRRPPRRTPPGYLPAAGATIDRLITYDRRVDGTYQQLYLGTRPVDPPALLVASIDAAQRRPGSASHEERLWLRSAIVGTAAAAVELAYWATFLRHYQPQCDANQYFVMAGNVAAGRGVADSFLQPYLHATAFRPPLYPLLAGSMFGVWTR